jgi:hypothetical protein
MAQNRLKNVLMEQLMESPAGSRGASATHKPTLKILAACENREGFLHSWWMQQQVEVCCGKEVEIARAFWCFALLRNEAMRRHAAREAAEAAMIVLALPAASRKDRVGGFVGASPGDRRGIAGGGGLLAGHCGQPPV